MKRLFDFVFASAALVLISPLMVSLMVLVRLKLGSPIFFIQIRPGLHGKPFSLIKFRTMTDARNDEGGLLADAERLTPFGKWLRETSFDELPELLNVIVGNMSLVGPRPLLMQYIPLYSPQQLRRQLVLPGITGLAQINGRNAISWDEKFALDVEYVDRHTMIMDIEILWKTVVQVLRRNGIAAEGEATMSVFRGNAPTDHSPDDPPR